MNNFYNSFYFVEAPVECLPDIKCEASLTECVDFASCINPNGALTVLGRETCNNTTCTACTDGVDCNNVNENGDGVLVECAGPDAYPANNGGTDGTIACICDGKNPCEWDSEDFLGDITEDDICITDHTCPVT